MMPTTTWTLTVEDDSTSVRTGLSNAQARRALETLMRGGSLPAAPAAEAAPAVQPTPVAERELVTA